MYLVSKEHWGDSNLTWNKTLNAFSSIYNMVLLNVSLLWPN